MKQVSTTELNARILKEGTCPSLSGRSLLTYHIGCTDDSAIHIRVHHNTGQGYFSREWISFASIGEVLGTGTGLTADTFRATFQGKSVNTAGLY